MLLGIDSLKCGIAQKEASKATLLRCNTFVTAAQLLFLDARWSFLLINLLYALIV